METTHIEYAQGNAVFEGYCAMDSKTQGKKPAVIVAHDWSGRNAFACQKAEQLAELGYVGFALDMYGIGQVGNTNEEKMALMNPLIQDRGLLRQRVLAALRTVKDLKAVDDKRVAIIGYCFGGACALDLGRSGADIRGVVSFHGLLSAPDNIPNQKMHAKVLVLHGNEDPMVPLSQVEAFKTEMNESNVDWQMHVFGHTMHGFTNPNAHDQKTGIVYKNSADQRSWTIAKSFLKEIFS